MQKSRVLNEVKINPGITVKDLKASLVIVYVHESTKCKISNRHDIHGRTPQRKPLLLTNNIAAGLKFAKDHLESLQHYWENVLGTDETKVELFGKNTQHYIWHNKRTVYQHEDIIPIVKYSGGRKTNLVQFQFSFDTCRMTDDTVSKEDMKYFLIFSNKRSL